MTKKSAGLLLYRKRVAELQLFLVHPGGPFWKNRDAGAWSIPKGEFTTEAPLQAAIRETEEETGIVCSGNFIELTPRKQRSGKLIYAWALEQDVDPLSVKSNEFDLEWPPRSGTFIRIPEVDRGGWFNPGKAREKIVAGQAGFIDELISLLFI